MTRGAPLRFLVGILGGWIVLRAAVLTLAPHAPPAVAPISPIAPARAPLPPPMLASAPRSAAVPTPMPIRARAPLAPERSLARAERPASSRRRVGLALIAPPPPEFASPPAPDDRPAVAPADATLAAVALVPATPPAQAPASRWSGNAWLFARGAGGGALAPGGQLGGGQAGARIAFALDPHLALAARVSTATGDARSAEAAGGVDWRPFGTAVPLRLSIERRVALGAHARDAWAAYAAGGVYRVLPGDVVLDGYAQAGVVGARRRDLFADGALRIGRRLALSAPHALTLGAGLWAAAQPGAARIDIGPRAAFSLPVGRATATLALEGRIRVAGHARPGTGPALTLAADF